MASHFVQKLLGLSFLFLLFSCNEKDAPEELHLHSIDVYQGSSSGGELITITGSGLRYVSQIYFGDKPCLNLSVLSNSIAMCYTPKHPAGSVIVTAINSIGHQSSIAQMYTFNDPPIIEGISPDSGSSLGGVEVAIYGQNFREGARVAINRVPCEDVFVVDAYQIICRTSPSAVGIGPVSVTNTDGTEIVKFDYFTVF